MNQLLEDSRRDLVQTLKPAARSRPRASPVAPGAVVSVRAVPSPIARLHALSVNKPVVLGSSIGGTQAIEAVLMALPVDCPGIPIVQHMPEKFIEMHAQRLDGKCAMRVRESRDGDRLERGVVLIAPGGRQMSMRKAGNQYFMVVADGPPVSRHKPSVDVLFKSAAECAGADALAIILTGMGDDGARGMKLLHDRGARTVAQNEETCVVYGMPREAVRLGAVDKEVPIGRLASVIMEFAARA